MPFVDHRSIRPIRLGHTQNDEETYILKHCPDYGQFLDIGAYDGETFSSSFALGKKGWKGVYVEPSPIALPKLYDIAKHFKCQVLPVAIGNESGTLPFYVTDDMVSSLDSNQCKKWHSNTFIKVDVEVITVDQLAKQVGTDFQMINIDVEGLNYDVFNQFDLNLWRPQVFCIEYDDKFSEIKYRLEKYGYSVCYVSAENIVAHL